MKKFYLLIFLFIPFITAAQNPDSVWFVNNYIKKEVAIPMRDGVKLFTSIYFPKDNSEKHPILLTRTPYSVSPYGTVYKAYWRNYMMRYCREGYIMVNQDIRGKYMSEGKFEVVRPFNPNKKTPQDIDEASDSYDTIDWLVKNIDNNNGNVGGIGISFPGFYATMIALSHHPALKVVSPQAPVTDRFFGDDDHHNGVMMLMDAFEFQVAGGFAAPSRTPSVRGARGTLRFNAPDNYEHYLKLGAMPNLTKMSGDTMKFWSDMMEHPNLDAWWKARDARAGIKDVKPAMLVTGGLFDAEDAYGGWETYKALVKKSPATNSKLIIGPWYHGQWASANGWQLGNIQFDSNTSTYYQDLEVPYFNYYLKGKGADTLSKATVFFSGENKWRRFKEWPVADAKQTPIYLQQGGKLSFNPSKTKALTFDSYLSDHAKPVPYAEKVHSRRTREYMVDDQRFAARRTDVLTYDGGILTEDITLAGPVIADLMVSLSGTDADFVVKLIDVLPDNTPADPLTKYPMGGYQMLVRAEIMRGKFRNSFEKPEPFVPNKPTQVKFTLPDIAHTFKKGHKMMIQIQSTWFPLTDRNPQKYLANINKATDADFVKETIKVYHNSSKVILPVIR
ncbi:CocE/NonD family hydrolase [Mucilaginibacter myungsuensis]|uniref:CocE/NonD family hydrolase n=1 Tax=Mucilaginibacter myungsuensis TaxID=649104 RepID=A0A929KW04_9SPHI|nr:CocE/NonD family hydrolase [Mucilaginibacter myungsuensis]MBE9662634.1 CocE/NonD family hydrolase [Mucilaginibacter myungsuensis]MDN3598054.1 CocE/NonD family hydrolase [Mucilaginibacter myungsuensis]